MTYRVYFYSAFIILNELNSKNTPQKGSYKCCSQVSLAEKEPEETNKGEEHWLKLNEKIYKIDIRRSAKLFECTWTKQTKFKLHVDYLEKLALAINIISYNA